MASNLKQMMASALKKHGYHGLYNEDLECGCTLLDFMPCGDPGMDCIAGWVMPFPADEDSSLSDYWTGTDQSLSNDGPEGETLEQLIERASAETQRLKSLDT
jgi:hypothetical protein